MTLLERKSDLLDAKVPLLTRLKFPRVWKRLPNGIRIEDLQEDKFDETLDHIKSTFLESETLCKLSNIIKDVESIEYFFKLLKWWMQDTQSLIAVSEESGKIVGVLIERVLDLYLMKTMSRVMNYHGESLQKMQKFSVHMCKAVNINEMYKVNEYNQIYIWSVDTSYRNMGIGKALLQACVEQTKSFKLSVLTGIFTSTKSQSIATEEGFDNIYELPFYTYKDKSPIIFEESDDNDNENRSAKLMILDLKNMEYNRNKCDEILQKYKITKLCAIRTIKRKVPNKES